MHKRSAGLKRPRHIPLMVTEAEKGELQKAADRTGMALSVFIRVVALEAARQREPVVRPGEAFQPLF